MKTKKKSCLGKGSLHRELSQLRPHRNSKSQAVQTEFAFVASLQGRGGARHE